ncbi:hypothetical protein BD780_004060 [Clostridium tetanomorphum]|uniref:Uncharacterized protein n=1 Tax=Clostridium tetanomorphum TaxID=1553 RepID=A0A923EAB1_CLOTT|nr:hypothetical protein [Clostridium tetanomorphum]KAJ48767.1 hypothetical protein CTM_26647 [Clostridium tetanomorphum DSM 665]KAJ53253.1 hypothetical protein CTM_03144 [Clostridium tetanomorphum DSM 665]MBC2399373.1 hypothetical protein [Clostridium tetanomorphum]MBP1865715.1 hypothetical protein [Clostridium tetanomorphum]NRS86835.1 hypothetical protein [Clostridium tetanomorphum]
MKIKKIIFLIIAIILGVSFIGRSKGSVTLTGSVFDYILRDTKGEVIEFGLITNFKHQKEGEQACKYVLENLKISPKNYSNILKNKKIYSVEFNNEKLEGYIQSTKYDEYNVLTLNIKEKSRTNELDKLEQKVKKSLGNRDVSFFKYVKAKIDDRDLEKENKKIMTLLRNIGGQEIQTVKLDNGFSTIANINKYTPVNVNGRLVDFNYAVCSYYSGNYIIMGTPEILISY